MAALYVLLVAAVALAQDVQPRSWIVNLDADPADRYDPNISHWMQRSYCNDYYGAYPRLVDGPLTRCCPFTTNPSLKHAL